MNTAPQYIPPEKSVAIVPVTNQPPSNNGGFFQNILQNVSNAVSTVSSNISNTVSNTFTGFTPPATVTQNDTPIFDTANPCDPTTDNSNVGTNNLISDPFFKTTASPLPSQDYGTVPAGVWYTSGNDLIQKIAIDNSTINKIYEFRVCAYGDASNPPTATLSGTAMGIKTLYAKNPYKGAGYLTDSNYWTLYRFLFTAADEYNSGNPYLVLNLHKNTNSQFMRPLIRVATTSTFLYVPPLSAHERVTSSTSTSCSNTSSAVALVNGDFSKGLDCWTPVAGYAGQSIIMGTDGGAASATLQHGPTGTDDLYDVILAQTINQPLAAHTDYHISMQANGTASAYFDFGNNVPSDAKTSGTTSYTPGSSQNIQMVLTTGSTAVRSGSITLRIISYRQQQGKSVKISNVHFDGPAVSSNPGDSTAVSWPTYIPKPDAGFLDDFSAYSVGQSLDKNRWILFNNQWGGNNSGTSGRNILLDDIDTGAPLQALRLYAFGGTDNDASKIIANGRPERNGSELLTNEYYGTGTYLVCAKLPQHTGVVSAFWPFHYLWYNVDQPGFWQESSVIRNNEIDWELPGTDTENVNAPSYNYARANNWGGQFGGEGGEDWQRVHFDNALNDGKFHEFGIIWYSGKDNGDGTRVPGYIKWTFSPTCVDHPTFSNPNPIAADSNYKVVAEAHGASIGQDNIPYRAAKFNVGVWFPVSENPYGFHAGGKNFLGWGGTPDFVKDYMDVNWVGIWSGQSIMPGNVSSISDSRDAYVPEFDISKGNPWINKMNKIYTTYPVK